MTTPNHGTALTEEIWREFRKELLAFVRRRVDQEADAEDVLQKVFLSLHQHLKEEGAPAQVRGWLYRVSRNAITDHLRSSGRESWALSKSTEEAVTHVSEEEGQESAEHLSHCLAGMVRTLPAEYRDALTWTELEGVTQSEAAARAGLSLSGMKSRVQRGREQLREALLACCKVELDRKRRPVDFECRDERGCGGCG